MRKFLILSITLLTLSVGLWAEENVEQNTLPTPASNQIIYRSSNHRKITLNSYNPNIFGPTYNDDQSTYNTEADYGVITCDGDITTIGDWAFSSKTTITAIIWPNSVTSIGILAFDGCTGITELTIPSTMTSIGDYAFNGCTNVTSVTFLGYVVLKGVPFQHVGTVENPVTLNLPSTWLASDKPVDSITPWYGGYFKCTSTPTVLHDVNSKSLIQHSKLMKNGQLLIRNGEKTYNALGF